MIEKIWQLINSKIGITTIGFLFTTIAAGWVNNQYQELAWLSKKQFEILQRTLDQQEMLTEELAGLMDDRYFWLQKVAWSLEDGDDPAKIKQLWEEDYYPTVIKWNRQMNSNLYRIKILTRFADPDNADTNKLFYTHEDDVSYLQSDTVHGFFKATHYAVRYLACCQEVPGFCTQEVNEKKCAADEHTVKRDMQAKLQQLAQNITEFLNQLQIAYDAHNERLDLQGAFLPQLFVQKEQ